MNAEITTFREYVRASRHLAESLRVNRSDNDFASKSRENNEIFYIFDANIVVNYVQREHGAVGGPFGTGALFTPTAKELNGELTLRWLFSGSLPGQRAGTAYLSPPHWDEALNLLQRGLKNEGAADGSRTPITAGTLDATLRPMLQRLKSIVDPRELLAKAEAEGIPQQLLTWVANYVTSNLRADSIFRGTEVRESSIRDLNNTERYWPAAMNAIRTRDYHFWAVKLREAWGNIDRNDPTKRGRSIDSDAYTLAAMQALHRENPDSGSLDPKVRFVFVTANRAIIQAVRANQDALKAEQIPWFLRHPSVYTPLLNYSAMFAAMKGSRIANDADLALARDVFNEVEHTLKSLLPADRNNTDSERASHARRHQPDIAENIELWSKTADQLSTVNIRYLFDDVLHLSEASRQIVDLLDNPDILVAGAGMISRTLARIRTDHVRQVSAVVLQHLATVVGSPAGSKAITARAVPHLIGVDLLAPLGGLRSSHKQAVGSLGELLRVVRSQGKQREQVMAMLVAELEKSWDDPIRFGEAQLLAASIYSAVDAWESAYLAARLCAERCANPDFGGTGIRGSMDIIRREADYCKSFAVRFTLRAKSEIDAAETTLLSSIARQVLTLSLATPRDKSEHAALMLTVAILQAIENVTPNEHFGKEGESLQLISNDAIRGKFEDAISDMRKTFDNFENFENLPPDRHTPEIRSIADFIRLQLATNLLGATIFSFILPRGMLSNESVTGTSIANAMRELRREQEMSAVQPPHPMPELYLAAGAFLIDPNPEAGEALKHRIAEMRSGALFLSRADNAELSYLEREVNARLVPRPAPTRAPGPIVSP